MTPVSTSAFDLPDRLAAKADPRLIATDEQHFAAMAASLERTVADLTERLARARRAPARGGTEALERDQEVHRLTARLRALRRYGLDLCLGRMVPDDGSEPVYVGRFGLTDDTGRRLLVDWRTPAAEPFFGATHARPLGLASRRRYRWVGGRITDYWEEVFTAEGLEGHAALDDQSAFIASLGTSRSPRMRDVLGTIQADQDAIIRASSRGALVVDGGPGTGKTVVALHRAAYLLYRDPLLDPRRGGVLFVGPHEPYLAYVSDVLPSLGEDSVALCLLRDLVPEGAAAVAEADAEVAALKATLDVETVIEAAARFYEQPPTEPLSIATPWANVDIDTAAWAEAFAAPEPGTPHNDAREDVWAAVLTILTDTIADGDEPSPDQVRRALGQDRDLQRAVHRAWPLLTATDLVGDLWSVPAYLRRCAPGLAPADVRRLQRTDATAWTVADLPWLDAARHRLGDPDTARRRHRRQAAIADRQERMAGIIEQLVEHDDSEMAVMSMLRRPDMQYVLIDEATESDRSPDRLAGPFAHVVVDEAQELTDAEWGILVRRCPSGSFTIVGDRAQARHGFPETWTERLARVGLGRATVSTLTVNYRTPAEVMAAAEPVIREALPDANVPTSIRESGVGVRRGAVAELDAILDVWTAAHPDGTAVVIGDPAFPGRPRVRSLSPVLAKGLEFDLVVLVDPDRFGTGIEGAVDRYVAMTRATGRLVLLAPGEPTA